MISFSYTFATVIFVVLYIHSYSLVRLVQNLVEWMEVGLRVPALVTPLCFGETMNISVCPVRIYTKQEIIVTGC